MSVIALAFERAGVVDPNQRLREILTDALDAADGGYMPNELDPPATARMMEAAMAALVKTPRNWDAAKDAFYSVVRKDPELMWALFEPYRIAAVTRVLTEVSAERHRKELAERPPERRQVFEKPRAVPEPLQAKAVNRVVSLSLLDTFKLGGKSIGDLTAATANAHAASREKDARFIRLLTQNLPPDAPIRKFRTADDAVEAMERAKDDQPAHAKGPFGEIYARRKAHTETREGWSLKHRDSDARRVMGKALLEALHREWGRSNGHMNTNHAVPAPTPDHEAA